MGGMFYTSPVGYVNDYGKDDIVIKYKIVCLGLRVLGSRMAN